MFLVEYHKDVGTDEASVLGSHVRKLRYFRRLKEATEFRKTLSDVERSGCVTREATHDDFWELAQHSYALAADSCAQQNYKRSAFWAGRATAFLDLASGHADVKDIEARYRELLYSGVYEEGDGNVTT